MLSFGGVEWLILGVVPIALFIGALVSVARSQTASGTEKAIWVLITLIVPVVGPILWFAIGKRAARPAA